MLMRRVGWAGLWREDRRDAKAEKRDSEPVSAVGGTGRRGARTNYPVNELEVCD